MLKSESNEKINSTSSLDGKICDFKYLTDMMGGKNHLIKEIIDVFLLQVPEELHSIHEAILRSDYAVIKTFSHTMKSSVSIMGISSLTSVLQEMEDLGREERGIEKIRELNLTLNVICQQAIEEIENEKLKFI